MIRLGGNSRVLYRVAYIIVAKQVCVRTCKVDRWVGFALVQHCRCFAWVHGEVAAVPRTMEPIKHPDQAPLPPVKGRLNKNQWQFGTLPNIISWENLFLENKNTWSRRNSIFPNQKEPVFSTFDFDFWNLFREGEIEFSNLSKRWRRSHDFERGP